MDDSPIQFPPTHVVNLYGQYHTDGEMHHGEYNPEALRAVQHPDHTEKNDKRQDAKCDRSSGVDIGMSSLINLYHTEHRYYVHETRIWKKKLKYQNVGLRVNYRFSF